MKYLCSEKTKALISCMVATQLFSHNAAHFTISYISDVDECLLGVCTNGGRCLNTIGGYMCQCPPGWTGPNCRKSKYRKVPKFLDARNLCCNLPKIQTMRPKLRVFYQMMQME